MERIFTDKIVTARKHYRCDASEQRMMVESAEADKWRILPG